MHSRIGKMTMPSRSSRAPFHMLICSSVGSLGNETKDCGAKLRLGVDAIACVIPCGRMGKEEKGQEESGGRVVVVKGETVDRKTRVMPSKA
jgi:hypothetical protein